jgi:guanosine-3',5'-bis(diphosphate) 3'-pyrophosphohydrolase
LFEAFELQAKEELYLKIGRETISLENLKKILKKRSNKKKVKIWGLELFSRKVDDTDDNEDTQIQEQSGPFLLREDQEEPDYRLAKCCGPIPGDDVIGYRNPDTSEDIIIHKSNCPIAIKLLSSQAENIIAAKWTAHKVLAHLARIRIEGIDRLGLANELTNIISKQLDINIRSMQMESRDGFFESEVDLYVHNTEHLANLLLSISKVKGVESVKRVEKS